jgi:large subunit ribosomal protein L4
MQVPVYKLTGEVSEMIEISDRVFDVPFNEAVVHQAVVRQRANARQGTASTKTRGEVTGSTRKLYRQKGTGYARAGSAKSPLRRGGGIMFGPKPRSYRQAMPKKMRQLALRCVLSAKARDGELAVLESLTFEEPKSKQMARILEA